jgi:hypothetical protein
MSSEPVRLQPGWPSWERAMEAAEATECRARRAAALLEGAAIPYAMCGGIGSTAWVASVEEEATRTSVDVSVILRRADLPRARLAFEEGGFVVAEKDGRPVFLDGPTGSIRGSVKIVFAGELLREGDLAPTPDVTESIRAKDFEVLTLEALIRMMLVSNRNEDGMLLRDLMGVGLFDASWPARFPPELAVRLQHVLDTPNG